jgi:chromosomal replication initiation ATPase DnaA
MWEIRQRTILSTPQIGRALGNRDHTTVLHGIKRHEKRLAAIARHAELVTTQADAQPVVMA